MYPLSACKIKQTFENEKVNTVKENYQHIFWKGVIVKRTRQLCTAGLIVLLIASSAFAAVSIKTVKPDGTPNKAAWMAQGGYGIMTHYLISPKGNTPAEKTADLNRTVDNFDLDYFMNQFDESGADWLIFTLAQGTGYLSSKNEFIDDMEKGFTPNRDLMTEIGTELHNRGKKLIIYLPGANAPADWTVKRLLGRGSQGYADRHNEFISNYSRKLGKLHDGWWFDSCIPQTNEAWQKEMDACRAGNPDSVIAFAGAEFAGGGPVNPLCPIEDYLSGDIQILEDGKIRIDFINPPGQGIIITADRKLRRTGVEPKFYMPDSQFVGNVQWQCLLPIDQTFNPAIPNQYCHYTDKELFKFVDDVKSVGGAITINVPIDNQNGHIPLDTHSQLVRLGKHLKSKK